MNKRLRLNPILKKDLLINARSVKLTVALTIINCILLLVVISTLAQATSSGSNFTNYYSNLVEIFPAMAILELAAICMMVPIITATSISGERERQTLEIMLTTPVSPMAIACGKLMSAIATTFVYVVASIPVMAVSFVVGGMSWSALWVYVGIVLYLDIFIGSIGIFYSSVKKTSVGATISTIATVAALATATIVIGLVYAGNAYDYTNDVVRTGYANAAATFFAINPVVWIGDVYISYLYNESLFASSQSYGAYFDFVTEHLALISVIVNMLFSVGVLKLASIRMRTGKRKRRRKIQ